MPYATVMGLPKEIKEVLPLLAQQVFMKAFNDDFKTSKDDASASAAAWTAVKKAGFQKAISGKWAKFMEDNEVLFGSVKGMEIFSTGKHTASNGTVVNISMDDLKEIKDFSNELAENGEHHAPIKIGHKKDTKGLPALGWAEKFYIKGEKLVADVVDIPNKLVNAINHNSWRKRSMELYPNFMQSGKRAVKAIALLGAEAPSLKGLNDIVAQYDSEETEEVLNFALEKDVSITIMTDGSREGTIIKVDGKELKEISSFHFGLYNNSEGVSSSYTKQEKEGGYGSEKRFVLAGNFEETDVEKLQGLNHELQKQLDHSELEIQDLKIKKEDEEMSLTEKELNAKEDQLKKDRVEFDEKQVEQKKKEDEQKEKETKFEEKQKADATAKFKEDVDALIKEFKESGKLLPAQEDDIRVLAMSYGENKIIKFGEKGKEVDVPVLDVMRKMLEKNVKQVDFAEKGTEGKGGSQEEDTKFAEFEKKVKELQKDNKDLSYSEAVKAVGEAEPELYEEYMAESEEEGDTSGKGASTSTRIKK